jgi:hypothetical protein
MTAESESAASRELSRLGDLLKIDPKELANLDPSLQQLKRADLLVNTPLPDPLTSVTEGEAYDIAKIAILENVFTLTVKKTNQDGKEVIVTYGGLPATMGGIKKLTDILPSIEGKRANQFVDAIKPAQPNIPVAMPREEEEGILDKVRRLIWGRGEAESERKSVR